MSLKALQYRKVPVPEPLFDFIKRDSNVFFFPVNIAKFLKTAIATEHL